VSVNFQYNKTSLQTLEKQLKIRERALPTLKNKESALRMEVKKAKDRANELEKLLKQRLDAYDNMVRLWGEFDLSLVKIKDVKLKFRKLAGVPTPSLEDIEFEVKQFFIFDRPLWILEGVALVKELASIAIEQDIFLHKMRLLDHARKKSTQKVNLYEKVQIPGYNDAIRKIKRFIEDEENLSKAAQKIVKSRKEQEVES
jgi:V/A-type H+-transporting ATPase subunit D